MSHTKVPLHTHNVSLYYHNAMDAYAALRGGQEPSLLFESSSSHERFGRLSLIGIRPALALTGEKDRCTATLLHARATPFLEFLRASYHEETVTESDRHLALQFPKTRFLAEERARFARRNAAQPIRALLQAFALPQRNFCGLYGALGYRFIYPYEDELQRAEKPDEAAESTPDYRLFLFDNILLFNHLTQECTLFVTRFHAQQAAEDAAALATEMAAAAPAWGQYPAVEELSISPAPDVFLAQVQRAQESFARGDMMEVVLSRKLRAAISGDPLHLYARYRTLSPSPYLFYVDFADEVLLGASPEMMVRVENGRATVRPISGTVRRVGNSIEEHHAMLALLNSAKEKSELDMLIDLARNDLARICEPGIQVEDYRAVEKYSHVLHTVAQVTGQLPADALAFDALVATLNAGTLTGAPKLAAMQHIEATETHCRGYYGGAVGYLLFNNEVNTGIVIRSAHIRDGKLTYLAGATLLADSDPEAELAEVAAKMEGFRSVLAEFSPQPA